MFSTSTKVHKIKDLSPREREQMWKLFSQYYADIEEQRFYNDMDEKQKVLLTRDGDFIVGFSTLKIYQVKFMGATCRVLFTGDTIKDRRYWGEKSFSQAFSWFLVGEWLSQPWTPLYWFLISKGYKTYLFGEKKFSSFWPRSGVETPEKIQLLTEHLATERYPYAELRNGNVLHFPEKVGRLADNAVPLTAKDLLVPEIRFFVSQNPGHAEGNELCCLGEVNFGFLIRTLEEMQRLRSLSPSMDEVKTANLRKSS